MSNTNGSLRAILFDFDGVILDTESALFASWQRTCADHNCSLSIEQWAANVGGYSYDIFDPLTHIEEQCGYAIDRETVNNARRASYLDDVNQKDAIPGVREAFDACKALGLPLAVVSSSSQNWVHGHLQRLGLYSFVKVFACGNEVSQVKPDPAVYHLALERLQLMPSEVVAIEDSPKGVAAARAAGVYCVAVPNPVTRHSRLKGYTRLLPSLADRPFADVVAEIKEDMGVK